MKKAATPLIGELKAILALGVCPTCKKESTCKDKPEIEKDYSACWYECDTPTIIMKHSFHCETCDKTFITQTREYE